MSEKWKPNDQEREILEELKRESEKGGNVAEFCRDFAPFSPSKFSKIMDVLDDKCPRSYFDDIRKPAALMAQLEEWLGKLNRMRLEKEQAKENPIYRLSTFRAVLVSVRQCKNKTSPERITKYIAPTGASKTYLRLFLQEELKNELRVCAVECRESWKPTTRDNRTRAKNTALMDIVKAIGMRLDEEVRVKGLPAIEDALITYCITNKLVLFFDEAEFFSNYTLNLLKTLLNKTRLLAVIACTPRAHAKWNSYYPDEADQIARRTHAVVQVSTVTRDDAALFFPDKQFDDSYDGAGYIAKEASYFGHYSLIQRVADILEKTTRAEKKEVHDAMEKARIQMGRVEWEGNRDQREVKVAA